MKRDIVKIDEDRCTGCGLCIPNCAEGALQVIDGKARLVSDLVCDGLGACIGHCPEGAITVEQREAEPYDESKVTKNIVKAGPPKPAAAPGGCPGSRTMDLRQDVKGHGAGEAGAPAPQSDLRQWPVQLHLLNPRAPYFKGADLVVAADCVPFAFAGFHERFLRGKTLVIFCPKLDDSDDIYIEKLAEVIKHNGIKSITVLHMEVPCCFGTTRVIEEALKRSGKNIVVKDYTISIRGDIV
jgi:ferredoxin